MKIPIINLLEYNKKINKKRVGWYNKNLLRRKHKIDLILFFQVI